MRVWFFGDRFLYFCEIEWTSRKRDLIYILVSLGNQGIVCEVLMYNHGSGISLNPK